MLPAIDATVVKFPRRISHLQCRCPTARYAPPAGRLLSYSGDSRVRLHVLRNACFELSCLAVLGGSSIDTPPLRRLLSPRSSTPASNTPVERSRAERRKLRTRNDRHPYFSRLRTATPGTNCAGPAAARTICDNGLSGSFRRADTADQGGELDVFASGGWFPARQVELGRIRGSSTNRL